MKKFFSLVLIFITALVLTACKKVVLTLNEADKTIAMEIGDEVTVTPALTEGFELEWESSDLDVVTVTPASDTLSAVIEATGEGTATVTLTVVGKTNSATISITVVKPDPTAVSVTGAGNVAIGATLQLTGAVTPTTADQTLTWTSLTPSVATVSSSGLVTGVAEGTVTIKATSVQATIYREVTITVVKPDPTGVTVTGPDTIVLNETGTFTATVAPTLAAQGVVWTSSDVSKATVAQTGVVTAIAAGEVTIRATSTAKSTVYGEKTITVVLPAPTTVTVSGVAEVAVGSNATYTAVVEPALASQAVTWSTSDVAKATIDPATGVLTAVAAGSVDVIATSVALNTIVGQKTVTVTPPTPTMEFELNGGAWTITSTDQFLTGTPKESPLGFYNATNAEYLAVYTTNIFINDANKKFTPSKWVSRAGLIKNAAGLYEVAIVLAAGVDTVDMSSYAYVLFAHEGYAAGNTFIKEMVVGELVTMTGFNIATTVPGPVVGSLKTYAAGSGAVAATAKMNVGTTLPIPSKADYNFMGWYANAEFTGDPITTVAASAKVYAKWAAIIYPATSVTLEGPSTATMGLTSQFTATVGPENATNKNVVWSVSDETIATISTTGLLTPVKEGTVVVTAASESDPLVLATKEVTIYGAPTSISFRGPSKYVVGGVGTVYGQVYTSGTTADQTALTYASGDETIFTVNAAGLVTAIKDGTATLTITSTIDPTKTKSQTITVVLETAAATEFPVTSVVVAAGKATKESLYYNYLPFVMGYNAFPTIAEAMAVIGDGAKVYVLEGTYADPATIAKNGVTFSGEGTITGKLSVAANVTGLTIDGLNFTGAGCVELALAGGIQDFTFKNNVVTDPTAATAVIYFKNDATALNKNISILDNTFEIVNVATAVRYIRGGNVENLTIIGNTFDGIQKQYVDAIRIEGTNESATAGTGVKGVLRIEDNVFDHIGQRAIWIRRYATTQIDLLNNYFEACGDQTYGGGIQLENWVSGQATVINFKYNTMNNMFGSFGLRLNNTSLAADATWAVNANYNKFIDFIQADGVVVDAVIWDNIVQAYSDTAKGLINADYNLFWRDGFAFAPGEDEMPFVGTYANQFAYQEDLELAIQLVKADPVLGVAIASEDMESFATVAYTATTAAYAGLDWTVKETWSSNPGDASDLTGQLSGGTRVIRLRGANVAYMETTNYIDGLTTLVFDAKAYNSSHATSVMKVSKMKEGDATWTEIATIPLTLAYVTQTVAINETGNVKIRIDVTVKSANIDNIKLYQSAVLYGQKYYAEAAPDATGFFVYPALASHVAGDRIIYQGESYYFGTNAFATLADLNGKLVANAEVILGPGTFTDNLTIDKDGVSLLGQNALISGNDEARNNESILTGTITIAKELKDITIAGIKFTGMAQIFNTIGTAGTAAAPTTNVDGFTFENNIVETALASGDAFLKFVEAASSYSHDLTFANNFFTTTDAATTLANVIRIDNNAGLIVTGNIFKDVKNGAFFANDLTKGTAGNTLISENTFENVGNGAILINWLSPLPSTTMAVDITKNIFTNVAGIALKLGSMNNSDVFEHINVLENVFTGCDACMWFNRVHAGANYHVNLNIFNSVPATYYITDGKTASTPVTLDAKDNIYKDAGLYITPDAAKFVGAPDYSSIFVTVPLTFATNGGSEVAVQNVLKDNVAVKPTDPTKAGYAFVNWYEDEALTQVFSFETPIAAAKTLYAKWSLVTLNVTYNLNEGYWKYADKAAMLTDFLTDLYAYIAPTDTLSDFIHGAGLTTGFAGTWNSNATYKAKIYGGYRPTVANAESGFFVDNPAYMDKWLSFFDNLDAFVKAVNPAQYFWDTTDPFNDTYVGLIRINNYMNSAVSGTYTAERLAMVPYYGSPKTFTVETPEITLKTPLRPNYTFGGWFTNAEFTGEAVTKIALGTTTDVVLYAKWTPEEYSITFNYNGGAHPYPIFADKTAMIDAFLTDLHTYVGATESLSDFMHGTGLTSGYNGLWINNATYKAKIYAGPRPTAVDEAYFISSAAYMNKWLPFFDMIEEFVKVNPAQAFYAAGTYTGLLRLGQYVKNVKPSATYTDEIMAKVPSAYKVVASYNVASAEITLPSAVLTGKTFLGWYANAEFTGDVVTTIATGSTGNKVFYAKWSE